MTLHSKEKTMEPEYLTLIAIASFAVGAGFVLSSGGRLGTLYRKRPARFYTIAVCFAVCVGLAAHVVQTL